MFTKGLSRIPTSILFRRHYGKGNYSSILKRVTKRGTTDHTSRDKIIHLDIESALQQKSVPLTKAEIPEDLIHAFLFSKTSRNVQVKDLTIVAVTSEGDGIGWIPRSSYDENCTDDSLITVIKVPKTVVGDIVTVTLRRHYEYYAEAVLDSVSRKSRKQSKRNERLVICDHFSECSGCQLQMIPYEDQLEFKKDVIHRAYRYFHPELDTSSLPNFGMIVESPMQFAYRTKITPHANVLRNLEPLDLPLPVGFDSVTHHRKVVDVNHCPIAVGSINKMLPLVKNKFQDEMEHFVAEKPKKRVNSNFILRDSVRIDHNTGEFENVCLTNRKNVITEQIDDVVFQFEANEFFQNNRYILPSFLDYIKHQLGQINGGYKYIVDAYCGSGFLGIALHKTLPEDGKVFGIEIAKKSIDYAHHNAKINGLYVPDKIEFVNGNSDSMFTNDQFLQSGVRGEDSVLLMNPSRKGSSPDFMKQLLEFRPKAVVYVSCNVFTQARDLADLENFQRRSSTKYKVKSITGFDFYPQTKHVESVAVLELVE